MIGTRLRDADTIPLVWQCVGTNGHTIGWSCHGLGNHQDQCGCGITTHPVGGDKCIGATAGIAASVPNIWQLALTDGDGGRRYRWLFNGQVQGYGILAKSVLREIIIDTTGSIGLAMPCK